MVIMKELKSRRYFQVIWVNYAGVDVLRELALSQSAVNDNIMVSTSEMLTVDHLLHIVDFYHPVFVRQLMMTAILMQQRQLTSSRRCEDTSDPRHFGPKTFRHHQVLFVHKKKATHTIKLITHIMSHVCTTNKWNTAVGLRYPETWNV